MGLCTINHLLSRLDVTQMGLKPVYYYVSLYFNSAGLEYSALTCISNCIQLFYRVELEVGSKVGSAFYKLNFSICFERELSATAI